MMALLIFFMLSLTASILTIFATILSSRLSRQENWTEAYDNVESTGKKSELRTQLTNSKSPLAGASFSGKLME